MVLTSTGEILTNNHVIRGATTIHVTVPATNRSYSATVVGYDVAADVAVLKLQNASGLQTVSFGDSDKLKRRPGGDRGRERRRGGRGSAVTKGTITALDQTITASDEDGLAEQLPGLIETNAGLQPGDSGGPLLNSSGRIIGMDTAASSSFTFQPGSNGGYAIPINRARRAREADHGRTFVGGRAHRCDRRSWASMSRPRATTRAAGSEQARSSSASSPGSPAERAGLVDGDVLITLGGRQIASAAALTGLVLRNPPGAKVKLGWVDQAGNASTATVTLASGPPQ